MPSQVDTLSVKSNDQSASEASGAIDHPNSQVLLNLVTKYMVLAILADVSSMLVAITNLIEESLKLNMSNLVFAVLAADCLANVLALYLQFEFEQEVYDKYCFKCHQCVKSRLIGFITKDMNLTPKSQTVDSDVIPSPQ